MPVAGIAGAKVFATRSRDVRASEAVRIMGGAGRLRGGRIERIRREAKASPSAAGPRRSCAASPPAGRASEPNRKPDAPQNSATS